MLFSEYLKHHAGKPVCLKVYNILQRGTRLVTLVPATQGSTSVELIGAKLRFENYTEAHTYLVAIKDVYLGGPAHQSSLHPHCDFIVGTPELTFTDVQMFAKYLQVNKGQEIDLVVYNLNEEACRHVRLTPSDSWGRRDQGLIGAEVCMGLLNTIPERQIDKDRAASQSRMKNIFSKLTNDLDVTPEPAAVSQQTHTVEEQQSPEAAEEDEDSCSTESIGLSNEGEQPEEASKIEEP